MEFLLTRGGQTWRIADQDDGDVEALLDWLCESRGTIVPLVAMSRQQVIARIGRATLPTDFPAPDVVIGDLQREAGHTRGWLEGTVAAWENAHLSEPDDQPDPPSDGSAEPAGTTPAQDGTAPTDGTDGDADVAADDAAETWAPKTRLWTEVPLAADDRVAIIASRGIVSPSGKVLAGPLPNSDALSRFLTWKWPRKPKDYPQLWLTYEALEAIGFPTDVDEDEFNASEQVAALFGCDVNFAQSGWFTCNFAADSGPRTARIVLIPLMHTDPPQQRPGDMGVAGWENTDTELPEDEFEAVKLLADRIAWLAALADGVAPASRWSTVGAQMLEAVRRRGRSNQKALEACPLPVEVAVESSGELEPIVEPQWDRRPHRAKEDKIDVEVDQRAAYLASAVQVELGHGKPKELQRINVGVFAEQQPPFGLWRITTPPCNDLDGLTRKLPRPHAAMQWEQPSTFWLTTRGVQQLTAPVELGGAGLSIPELDIDAAWVWPQKGRLLRTWASDLRSKLIEARTSGREDYQDFIKAIYTTYLGRMSSEKWPPHLRHHQQPAWYAAIRADTRWRALRYARAIADAHDLYPVSAELDAWIYRIDPDMDLAVLTEESTANGKYRVKWTSRDGEVADPAADKAEQ
ncbi:hypothetical protein MycrhDRAFT_5558 [Mycolicibacterium rhodesiae JS60]|nr:hypothetical protein MycrhDRAFT_5558 [Mycolicibacterium rhodesiae JS60]